jgi:hypothetical protein
MGLQPITAAPGLCLSASNYAVGKDYAFVGEGNTFRQGSSRWIGGENVEFIAGFPQKIAGWSQAVGTTTVGIPRVVLPWRDNNGATEVCVGTTTHLYALASGVLTDITPLRTISTGTLTNPFTTTASSTTVAVADSSQVLVNGDWVYLSAAAAVGGVTVNGWYAISGSSGTGYNITVAVAAGSGAGPGGGATTFSYPRVNLTNPFTTTNASTTVTVQHASSGAVAGAYVTYSGATAVGGLTINGQYQIQTIIDSGHYTIAAASAATSGATGGGTVSVTYDIVVQQSSTETGIGWGQGSYGQGNWNVGQITPPVLANGWTLAAYGYQMLACPIGGTIYVYDPSFGGTAYPLLNAPVAINAMFVTPERFVVALGLGGNQMEMAWADQADYTQWTTTITNTANSGRTIVGGNYLVGGIGIRDGTSLFWSNTAIFTMVYNGSNEVYTTQQAGDNCGLIDPTAVVAEGGVAFWQSDQDFWTWNGSASALPSDDIRAYVFQNINRQYLTVATAALNRRKRQVRFWYPSGSSVENDIGVLYHYDQQCWSILGFGKSCGCDAQLLPGPLSCDTSGMIYNDEVGTDANGTALPTSIQLGLTDISNGDRNADIMGFIPDFETLTGTISLTVNTVYFSPPVANTDGPYAITVSGSRQDLRSDGKAFAIALAQTALGATFRLGVPRLDVQPAGARS